MIYEQYFALKQRPFSIAPNPSFLYACGQYQEALAALEYGMLHRGGFVLLTGEVGTGKTTLCKYLLQEVPQDTELALILHPQLDRIELLQLICKEFGIETSDSAKESQLIEQLTEFLLSVYAKGGYSVLIIDEAQHLDASVLELIRLLTNLETHEDKLLQIILLGQPELRDRLNRYDLRQLNQRFTARFHLDGLSFLQTRHYIEHRLEVAGGHQALFSAPAIWMLNRLTKGIPRLINVLADRCLMGCYAEQKQQVSVGMVLKASKEVLAQQPIKPTSKRSISYIGLALAASVIGFGVSQSYWFNEIKSDFNNQSQLAVVESTNQSKAENKQVVNPCHNQNCWFGYLPARIIEKGDLNGQVWLNDTWQTYHNQPINVIGQVPVAVDPVSQSLQQALIKPFDSHSLIPWVRDVLSELNPNSVSVDTEGWQIIAPDNNVVDSSNIYDVVLHDMVKTFQQKNGLLVDGILGPQTLISLSLLGNNMEMVAH